MPRLLRLLVLLWTLITEPTVWHEESEEEFLKSLEPGTPLDCMCRSRDCFEGSLGFRQCRYFFLIDT